LVTARSDHGPEVRVTRYPVLWPGALCQPEFGAVCPRVPLQSG